MNSSPLGHHLSIEMTCISPTMRLIFFILYRLLAQLALVVLLLGEDFLQNQKRK